MKIKKTSLILVAVFSFFIAGISHDYGQERVRENVEVVNINVPVRVFLKGKPVEGLQKEDFKLFINGNPHPVNAFFQSKRKVQLSGKPGASGPRLFVLLFNISD
ncbi:MAG: hypothetical protein GY940_13150, partial [bacterium]|nr:hypothetical protein [bacterium]